MCAYACAKEEEQQQQRTTQSGPAEPCASRRARGRCYIGPRFHFLFLFALVRAGCAHLARGTFWRTHSAVGGRSPDGAVRKTDPSERQHQGARAHAQLLFVCRGSCMWFLVRLRSWLPPSVCIITLFFIISTAHHVERISWLSQNIYSNYWLHAPILLADANVA